MCVVHTIIVVMIWPFSKCEPYGVGSLGIATKYTVRAILV
jgi:hypothetical protein